MQKVQKSQAVTMSPAGKHNRGGPVVLGNLSNSGSRGGEIGQKKNSKDIQY